MTWGHSLSILLPCVGVQIDLSTHPRLHLQGPFGIPAPSLKSILVSPAATSLRWPTWEHWHLTSPTISGITLETNSRTAGYRGGTLPYHRLGTRYIGQTCSTTTAPATC